jgi:hypothetical protein
MTGEIARLLFAAVLAASAVLKLAGPRATQAALASFGFGPGALRWSAWGGLVAVEVALAAGVAAGSDAAAYGAAALMAALAALLVSALLRGMAGAPCGCFGARSRVSWRGVARNALLAAGFLALPALPGGNLSTDQWLTIGVVLALALCAVLSVAVLALAREVGMLRLRLGPQSALEVLEEGPELGGHSSLVEAFDEVGPAGLALAVFVSDGCRVCQSLEPAIRSIGLDPMIAVRVFEEDGDNETWREAHVPGSPYAVALDREGTVLAKGTFNTLPQLESVLATAEHRRSRFRRQAASA